MTVTKAPFGTMPDGRDVFEFTIENDNGMKVSVLSLGATLRSIILPDKNGNEQDILLGFDTVADYLEKSSYQGAAVGPCANRIGGGKFIIDEQTFDVIKNETDQNGNGVTCLHSGGEFSFEVWQSIIADSDSVEFCYTSPDGLNGFPGEMKVQIVYKLGQNNDLHISYKAVCDRKTPINLTNHAYFNLAGYASGNILSHVLQLNCSQITPVDAFSIPTGELMSVAGTAFDFTEPKQIGRDINNDEEQLKLTGGYDHNFVIDAADGTLQKCAYVYAENSGIVMNVYTTMPGVQFYAGNFLKGETGKSGTPMEHRSGFCLETQYYPDSPNKPSFPNCIFDAGQEFISETVYTFETMAD
ncbi:MAG: galactose mutarotase [Clostridia bacterium]|nr:galactose mutarotase [Clostridia bacterium]